MRLLSQRLDEAEEHLRRADAIVAHASRLAPYYMGAYRTSHLLVDVLRMGDGRDTKRAKVAKKSAKLALASAKRIARERPESLRWSGRAMALRGKPERALDLYGRAVDEAQRLGAIPELSRACAELAGLIGEDAKYRELTAAQWRTRAVEGFVAIGIDARSRGARLATACGARHWGRGVREASWEPLGPAVLKLLAEFWATQPPTEFRPAVEAWLARHYAPERTVADAFAGAVAELLGPLGVVVFQPTHPAAKAAMAPYLLRSLELAASIDGRLADRATTMAAAGRPAPVPVGEGAALVMLEGAAGRDRLFMEDGTFHLRRSGERFSLGELARVAERSPERLSPNVLLRPVVEGALLPTVAYVGGPGELAYLPQCAPIYDAHGIPPQVPVPRWSGVVLETRTRKVLEKYGIAVDDLRLPEGQLEQRLVRGELSPEALAALGTLRETLEREYDDLRDAAVAVDPTLRKPVESTRYAALAGMREVEKRLLSHLKQRNDTLVQQLARTRAALFPLAKPQERILGAPAFLTRYGEGFLTTVLDAVRQWVARR